MRTILGILFTHSLLKEKKGKIGKENKSKKEKKKNDIEPL